MTDQQRYEGSGECVNCGLSKYEHWRGADLHGPGLFCEILEEAIYG